MSVAHVNTNPGRFGRLARWQKVLSPTGNTGDAIFRVLLSLVALFVLAIVLAMMLALGVDAMQSIRQFGFGFITSRQWNPIS